MVEETSFTKYRSRKFILSFVVLTATVVLALTDKMGSDVAMVLTAIISSYNVIQGWVDREGAKSG